jgi:hypothetical protein
VIRARNRAGTRVGAAVTLAFALLILGAGAPRGLRAATPSPSPSPSEPAAGDTRSSGEGAGFVGAPFVAVGLVLAVGLLAAGATLVYVRLTAPKR